RWSICFFFSSRRRHTRFDCDWSSDVCSSDLAFEEAALQAGEHVPLAAAGLEQGGGRLLGEHLREVLAQLVALAHEGHGLREAVEIGRARVGKEGRERWGREGGQMKSRA